MICSVLFYYYQLMIITVRWENKTSSRKLVPFPHATLNPFRFCLSLPSLHSLLLLTWARPFNQPPKSTHITPPPRISGPKRISIVLCCDVLWSWCRISKLQAYDKLMRMSWVIPLLYRGITSCILSSRTNCALRNCWVPLKWNHNT